MSSASAEAALRTGRSEASSLMRSWGIGILLLVAFAGLVWSTTPVDMGDTVYYTGEILHFAGHPDSGSYHTILDFGHLVWRPTGLALLRAAGKFTVVDSPNQARLLMTKLLIGVSVLSGAIIVLLMYSLSRMLRLPVIPSLIALSAIMCSNALVNTSQSGAPYAPALAALTGSVALLIRSMTRTGAVSARAAWLSGAALALAILLWFPFVLTVPAVAALAALRWDREAAVLRWRDFRISPALHFCLAVLAATGVTYAFAAYSLGVRNLSDAAAWLRETEHGLRQSRNYLRAGMGIARCCFAMGDDGILWKRFLFHDPYAHVGLGALVRGSIGKLLVFYGGAAIALYTLLRLKMGRLLIFLLGLATLPTLYFAIFLYEPSSIERFMPVFPFILLALAFQLSQVWPNTRWRLLSLILPVAVMGSTLAFHWNGHVRERWNPTVTRLQLIEQDITPGSTIVLVSPSDRIHYFAKDNPLDPAYPDQVQLWNVVYPANTRALSWRSRFAARLNEAWSQSRELWISERLLSAAPQPDWDWIEGDDPAVRWRDLPAFFRNFEYDKRVGGEDGFVRVAFSDRNRARLSGLDNASAIRGSSTPALRSE